MAYASDFWKPGDIPKDGIGLVAKANYESILNAYPNHDAIYLDASEYNKIRGIGDVTALFSISASIDKFRKVCKPDTTTLLSVNESALLRRTIKDHGKQAGYGSHYLNGHDGIYSNLKEVENVDFILGFGAWSLFQSYVKIGVAPEKVYPIGWHYWADYEKEINSNFGKKIVAYLGAICYRKGIDKIIQVVSFLSKEFPDYRLELAGFAWNKNWEVELNELALRFPKNFTWKNERVQYGKNSWLDLKRDSCFAIFPSFEEGLSGCAMDIINLGIPLFHSAKTGIEPSHEAVFNLDFEKQNWPELLGEILKGGHELWSSVAKEQRKAAFHQNFANSSLSKSMERISNGFVWPTVAISGDVYDGLDAEGQQFADKISSGFDPEYTISSDLSRCTNGINVIFGGPAQINAVESLQMSIYLADKYNNFPSLIFKRNNLFGPEIDLSVIKENYRSISEDQINLYMCSYSNFFLSRGNSIKLLWVREIIATRIYGLKYRVTRMFNISRLKLLLVLNAASKKMHR